MGSFAVSERRWTRKEEADETRGAAAMAQSELRGSFSRLRAGSVDWSARLARGGVERFMHSGESGRGGKSQSRVETRPRLRARRGQAMSKVAADGAGVWMDAAKTTGRPCSSAFLRSRTFGARRDHLVLIARASRTDLYTRQD